jgi:hypothetical protein
VFEVKCLLVQDAITAVVGERLANDRRTVVRAMARGGQASKVGWSIDD